MRRALAHKSITRPYGPLKNARHESFAHSLAKGESQRSAYRLAGYRAGDPQASRLVRNGKVSGRVDELKAAAAKETVTTIADMVAQFDEDRAFAFSCRNPAAAINASIGKAKLLGML